MNLSASSSVFGNRRHRVRDAFWTALCSRKELVVYVVIIAAEVGFIALQFVPRIYRARVLIEVLPDHVFIDYDFMR